MYKTNTTTTYIHNNSDNHSYIDKQNLNSVS